MIFQENDYKHKDSVCNSRWLVGESFIVVSSAEELVFVAVKLLGRGDKLAAGLTSTPCAALSTYPRSHHVLGLL